MKNCSHQININKLFNDSLIIAIINITFTSTTVKWFVGLKFGFGYLRTRTLTIFLMNCIFKINKEKGL
jgi:hypothetical protein